MESRKIRIITALEDYRIAAAIWVGGGRTKGIGYLNAISVLAGHATGLLLACPTP